MEDPSGLAFVQALTDRALRPRSVQKVVHIAKLLLQGIA